MRRILSLLCEYRVERLKQRRAPEAKLGEVREMYRWFDSLLSGVRLDGQGRIQDPESALAEVMTTADFVNALGDFVQRQVVPGYLTKRFDFEQFIKPDEAPNYQTVNRKQMRAGVENLEHVPDKAPARPGSVVDATEREYKVEAWKKQFDFSMRTLVNDDISYLRDTARNIGLAARRSLEEFVSRMLWNATTVGWLNANAPLYSTTGRLTSSRIATGRMMFNQRTDTRNKPIAATLRYLVHHPGLVDTVRVIRQSALIPELATNAANVIAGDFVPIEDPYCVGLAPAPFTNLPWFAMADWRVENLIPFVLLRRQGFPAPKLLRKRSDIEGITDLLGGGTAVAPVFGDFATNNVVVMIWDEWGTYIDAGAIGTAEGNMFDVRSCYYSSGTAP